MKIITTTIIMLISMISYAQNVEVQGQLKIVNGTQGANKYLQSDANGVTKWVTEEQIFVNQLKNKKGGIQRLLDFGFDPYRLWELGVRADSLIGKPFDHLIAGTWDYGNWYNGGYIYFLDTLDQHPFRFAVAEVESTYNPWGCSGTAITAGNGAQGELVWDGILNTTAVQTQCPGSGSLSSGTSNIFRQVLLLGNWKIASKGDATLIYNTIIATGKWNPSNSQPYNLYWLSTEATGAQETTHAWRIDKLTGAQTLEPKSSWLRALNYKTYN